MNGVSVVTYNRAPQLSKILPAIEGTVPDDFRLVVCDDGSDEETLREVQRHPRWVFVRGTNQGVAANKNRALFAMQDCDYMAVLEDDLMPNKNGWFEMYRQVAIYTDTHHFCRVQDKRIKETDPRFHADLLKHGVEPIYGPSPRGDFTFITQVVLQKVGGLNPRFKGVGYAHGEWSNRIVNAGLVKHPNKWIDLRTEDGDPFEQIGDMEGGRWNHPKEEIKAQMLVNKKLKEKLAEKKTYFCPLTLA
jgi:glycosyltransferase involved in cell wall biosynthesis